MVTREYPPFEVGGVARHTFHLVKHLRELGVECTVLSFGDPGYSDNDTVFIKPKSSVISKQNAKVAEDTKIPFDIVRLTKKAKKMLTSGEYDIVHVQEPYVGGLIGYNDRKITTIHDTSYGELKGIINHPITSSSAKRAVFYISMGYPMEFTSILTSRIVVAPSHEVKYELEKIYRVSKEKIRLIYNGVEPPAPNEPSKEKARKLLDLPENKVILFTTAQHIARKRLDVLIEAIKILRDRGVSGFLTIIGGEGPLMPTLKTLTSKYSLESQIVFTGWIPEKKLPLYYHAADIFTMTSDYEAGPMTLLEAGVRGVALISSRIGGFAALMRDGDDGLLFPKGEPAKLADALEMLMNDESLRRRLSENAKRFSMRFTWRNAAAKTRAIYRELLRR